MNWSDTFYPGNPERRDKLVRRNQELLDLMKNNFHATNQLTETLQKLLHLSFGPIAVNEKATVKENCDIVIERIHKIQAEVEMIDTQLKEKLEPTLYEKLKNMSLSNDDHQNVSGVFNVVCGVTSSVATIVVGWLIKNGTILSNLSLAITKIGAGFAGLFAFGMIIMGLDMMIGAILGSIEKEQLGRYLEEYEKALEEFRPASETYQDSITYVRIKIEMTESE